MTTADEAYDRLHGVDGHMQAVPRLTAAERGLLADRFVSWFGDERQAFLVSHVAPTIDRIIANRIREFQWNALEMARKADIAEAERDAALAEVERLKGATARRSCGGSGLYPNEVPGVGTEWVGCPGCEWCDQADGHENGCRLGLGPDETCDHQWLDRPESDTRECLICGTEVAG